MKTWTDPQITFKNVRCGGSGVVVQVWWSRCGHPCMVVQVWLLMYGGPSVVVHVHSSDSLLWSQYWDRGMAIGGPQGLLAS